MSSTVGNDPLPVSQTLQELVGSLLRRTQAGAVHWSRSSFREFSIIRYVGDAGSVAVRYGTDIPLVIEVYDSAGNLAERYAGSQDHPDGPWDVKLRELARTVESQTVAGSWVTESLRRELEAAPA